MEIKELEEKIRSIVKTWTVKPVLFIGSGISRRYKDLPDWKSLLTQIAEHVFPNDKYYMRRKLKEYQSEPSRSLQKIAQDLSDQYDEMFFKQEIDVNLQESYDKMTDVNPFKFYLSTLINSSTYNECYYNEQDSFKALSKYVSNVITTNYDTILDENFNNFTVKTGEEEMLNSRLYNIQELYKIHGSVTKPNSIIFTINDYDVLEANQKYLIAKLLTTFIEYPIIFMGYSIQDTDINSILSDIKNCLSTQNLEMMANKMIFINYVEPGKENIHSRYTQDIPMTQIDLNDYTVLYNILSEVKTKFEIGLLRTISEMITKLVYSEEKNNNIVRVTNIDKTQNDDLAVIIGSADSILKIGYCAIEINQIYEDIFRSNANYDSELIIESTLPQMKSKLGNVRFFPLHKLKKTYNKQLDPWLANKELNSIDDFFHKKASFTDKNAYEKRKKYKTISEIENKFSYNEMTIINNVFLNADHFSDDELKDFLERHWDINENKTVLKKIVVIYDYKKYK